MKFDVNDRIIKACGKLGLSQQKFAERVGISKQVASNIFNHRNMPSQGLLKSISQAIPEISVTWLLTGAGDMYTGEKGKTDMVEEPQYELKTISETEYEAMKELIKTQRELIDALKKK